MVVVKTYQHPFIRTFFMSMIHDVAGFIGHHFHLLRIQMYFLKDLKFKQPLFAYMNTCKENIPRNLFYIFR